jgi:hypothetical protein
MENNETCIHGGVSPISLLAELHHSQAGSGRHRCPTYAYEQGFNLGSSGNWNSYEKYCNTLTESKNERRQFTPTFLLPHFWVDACYFNF